MIESNNIIETSEARRLKSIEKWERICKTTNIILSFIYVLFGWIFGFLGIMFFSLGFSDEPFVAICSFLSSLLFLLTPVSCVLGICLSVLYRKKKAFSASFLIQFLPFGTLGFALVSFLLSII